MAVNQIALKILVPDGTTNYIKNPSFRYDTTGWVAQGATLTRTLERALYGISGGKVVTNGAVLNEGVLFRVSELDGISDNITISIYVRGSGTVRLRLDDNAIGGQEYASQPKQINDLRWTRLEVSGRCHGGDDVRLCVESASSTPGVMTFYIDGAQMERKGYATTYCDGDQDKCSWSGIYHDSTSSRPAGTRAGGRWVELSGPNREAENLYMTVVGGLGVAPLTNNVQRYALEAGGYHQGIKVDMRPITFTFHSKNEGLLRNRPVNLEKLHELRQFLIDEIKPDLTGGDEDILFEYRDGDVPLYFRARYDGGLEGEWDVRNGWVNSFPLRLLAVSPYLYEDSQEAQTLDFQEVLYSNEIIGRINGRWSTLNYGLNSRVYNMTIGPRGEVYACGLFTVINNNAAAEDPLRATKYIAYWDGAKWNALGGGADNGSIQDVKVGSNQYVYVTGSFTSIGGVAANRAAYWDGSAWNAMGSGLNNEGYVLLALPDGDIIFGGKFTTAGGLNCYRIARWDGSSWHRMGQFGGLNDEVYALECLPDASLYYVGGKFTDQQGFAANAMDAVAQYDPATGLFSAMGSGLSGILASYYCNSLKYAFGKLYAGCYYVSLSGTTDIENVAVWSGAQWEQLGPGIDNPGVRSIDSIPDGRLIMSGQWSNAGGVASRSLIQWNGSSFLPVDMRNYGANYQLIDDVAVNQKNGNIFVSLAGQQTSSGNYQKVPYLNNVVNPGSAHCYPRFYIKGPGTLLSIENQTTGKTMYINIVLASGEEVVIDPGTGRITSNLYVSLDYSLLPGSDFRAFFLVPGLNVLACFMDNDVNASMSVQFTPRHWGADAGTSLRLA